jgi:ABC-type glycerol-3-phosphate transport system substrate-binding protein
MKKKSGMNRAITILLALTLLTSFATSVNAASTSGALALLANGSDVTDTSTISNAAKYLAVASTYKDMSQYNLGNADNIVVKADSVKDQSVKTQIKKDYEGYNGMTVVSDLNSMKLNWEVNTSKTGLYEIQIDYLPFTDDKSQIQRRILIDGKLPFQESGNIGFTRTWKDDGTPNVDTNGDQITPRMIQVSRWGTNRATDVDGMLSYPFRYLLESGKHTITIEYVNGNMAIGDIRIVPAQETISYNSLKQQYSQNGYTEYKGLQPIVYQAEKSDYRSDQTLSMNYDSDPATKPYIRGKVVLNTIGGWNWRKGNQKVEWIIDVPESALYKLNTRVFQNHGEGLNVYRQITVDNLVPFKEVAEYAFGYSNQWQSETISDKKGDPYLFYLSKGKHSIAITAEMGASASIINGLYDINDKMSALIRNITKITGSDPDLNFDYNLKEKVPTLITDIKNLRDKYRSQVKYLIANSRKTPTLANSLLTAADQLDYLINNPSEIPAKLKDLITTQSSVATWYYNIQDQPMMLDYIQLTAPLMTIKPDANNILEKIAATFVNFISSFYKDYNSIMVKSSDGKQVKKGIVLDVWVARSKEMGEILQRMANEEFTTKTGIGIKINILPVGTVGATSSSSVSPLMLSIISGKVPDLAMGSDSQSPVELAFRNASYDLSKFSDFKEVANRFLPQSLIPVTYNGGVYALPETMDFKMMFYRRDILGEIGVKLPDIWTDLYNKVIPILEQNGMKFYMASDFSTYLYQNGGKFYNDSKTKTAINSEEAYRAFLQWTKNYTVYNLPKTADIYNHFRIGDIPLVIGGYQDYIKLTYAAPELYGKWGIANIPGTLQTDGTIDRSFNGDISTLCMFTKTKFKNEAWTFAKWWTEAEVQEEFSSNIEAQMGLEARWNTANVEAFLALPWPREDAQMFKKSLQWLKGMPNTLGGYYTTRDINNAWTRTVLNGQNPRTSIEQAIKEIKTEMLRKQVEYGVVATDKTN